MSNEISPLQRAIELALGACEKIDAISPGDKRRNGEVVSAITRNLALVQDRTRVRNPADIDILEEVDLLVAIWILSTDFLLRCVDNDTEALNFLIKARAKALAAAEGGAITAKMFTDLIQ